MSHSSKPAPELGSIGKLRAAVKERFPDMPRFQVFVMDMAGQLHEKNRLTISNATKLEEVLKLIDESLGHNGVEYKNTYSVRERFLKDEKLRQQDKNEGSWRGGI